jgi:hypothetical protein
MNHVLEARITSDVMDAVNDRFTMIGHEPPQTDSAFNRQGTPWHKKPHHMLKLHPQTFESSRLFLGGSNRHLTHPIIPKHFHDYTSKIHSPIHVPRVYPVRSSHDNDKDMEQTILLLRKEKQRKVNIVRDQKNKIKHIETLQVYMKKNDSSLRQNTAHETTTGDLAEKERLYHKWFSKHWDYLPETEKPKPDKYFSKEATLTSFHRHRKFLDDYNNAVAHKKTAAVPPRPVTTSSNETPIRTARDTPIHKKASSKETPIHMAPMPIPKSKPKSKPTHEVDAGSAYRKGADDIDHLEFEHSISTTEERESIKTTAGNHREEHYEKMKRDELLRKYKRDK